MPTSESRTEVVMKPLLIKAAVTAALSVAVYACAKIISKRSNSPHNLLQSEDDEGFKNFNSISPNRLQSDLQDKILELEIQVEDLKKRECDSEARLNQFRSLKERENMLTEMKNSLVLERTRAECLLKEISSMEEENQRMGDLVIQYTKVLDQIQSLKTENRMIKMKAWKHWRKEKQKLRILRKQKMRIESRDAEILKNREELDRRAEFIQELEVDVAQLKRIVDHLQREKIDLFNKLDFAEKLSSSSNPKIEIGVIKEEHERVEKELEQVKKEREEEAKEVSYLKWSNACLRHELQRCHEQAKDRINEEMHDCDCDATISGNEDDNSLATYSLTPSHVVRSRRRRLVQKFKRWVEGGKNEDRENGEIKCFCRLHVSDEAKYDHARKSCSSV